MKKFFSVPSMLAFTGIALLLAVTAVLSTSNNVLAQGTTYEDHSTMPELAGPFEKPQDVTAACLSCHDDAATEIMGTVHWTWEYTDPVTGQQLGKNNVVNNYCIGLDSNEPRCTSCHVGYGYKDNTFDFTSQNNVDCLVCHADPTVYKKFPAGAGNPLMGEAKEFPAGSGKMWEPVDLTKAAQSVRPPTKANCGSCHFFGGGGDAVKHGDLDTTMGAPSKDLDVHMSMDGQKFECEECHAGENHQIKGMIYNGEERVECQDCHDGRETPHQNSEKKEELGKHTEYIACQTCHIPAFARGEATKMSWDWSTAGERDADGKPIIKKDEAGHIIYDGQKGTFTSADNVMPYYQWWNGQTMFLTPADVIDPTQIVTMTDFQGGRGDGKIYPFKRFTGKQPYDAVNNVFVVPNLFANSPEDTDAYWKGYDWNAAITSGMTYAGYEYSGQYDWVETEFFWVQNHQVAPAENAVQCEECHTADDSRLDFAALGYTADEVSYLTVFPPEKPEPTAVPAPTEAPVVEQAVEDVPAESAGNNTWIIVVVVVLVLAVIAYLALRPKKV